MSTTVKDMLATYPAGLGDVDREKLARCIEECIACAQACTACADTCLSEGMVGDPTKCIRTDMDCADICNTTASALSRHTGYDANITRAMRRLRHRLHSLRRRMLLARRHARTLPSVCRRLPLMRTSVQRTAPYPRLTDASAAGWPIAPARMTAPGRSTCTARGTYGPVAALRADAGYIGRQRLNDGPTQPSSATWWNSHTEAELLHHDRIAPSPPGYDCGLGATSDAPEGRAT